METDGGAGVGPERVSPYPVCLAEYAGTGIAASRRPRLSWLDGCAGWILLVGRLFWLDGCAGWTAVLVERLSWLNGLVAVWEIALVLDACGMPAHCLVCQGQVYRPA